MRQAVHALNGAERRDSNFDGITRPEEAEFFEQVANCGGFGRRLTRAKFSDGLQAIFGFDSSAGHTPILHA